MASSYNVVLLVDAADLGLKERVTLLSLRLLNFLTCRAGLGQVRWSYRFLNSLGGRCRPPRRCDLRELGARSWAEFEEELEACWQRARHSRSSGAPRAALTHTALMDTLSDFQWDRPDISSPAKPAVVRGRRGGGRLLDEAPGSPSQRAAGPGCRNAVFVLSPCPHSREQLGHFSGGDPGLQHVMDRLLSRGLHHLLTHRRVTLHWLDTADWAQVWQNCDHFGYWTMGEVMQHVGGRIIPSECLLESSFPQAAEHASPRAPLNIPFESVLCSLFSSELEYRTRFPQQDGVVTYMVADVKQWECAVILEPISSSQKLINDFMTIHIRGTVQNWNENHVGPLTMESWLLHPSSCHSSCPQFKQLLDTTSTSGLFLVADVSFGGGSIPRTGVLSPISENAAALSVICSYHSVDLNGLQHKTVTELPEDVASDLPDIVNSVISQAFSTKENTTSPEVLMPEWINQELSQSSHWGSSVIEGWYPLSGMSGASANLMESFRLISAASFDQDDQNQKSDQEMTHYLSELYQKKTDESVTTLQGEYQKKRLHCTPVRQKMKSMPRALQMLNVARLNSKAQKLPPESAPVEKSAQVKRRSSDNPEGKPAGFKTEEELNSYLIEDYNKMVSSEEDSLLSSVRNSLTTIKSFLKSSSSKQIETDCLDRVRLLLKTSKVIRQLYGQNQNKVAKLRECQIQALLRLEMCAQCPALQTNEEELEQVVEEITDMLRIISLTEDPSYLTKFLAGVLAEYIASIPKILADIYFSLGTQIPEELKLVLPAGGDDSFILDGQTPLCSQPSISRVPSVPQAVNEEDQLEELRTRSAKKRRTSTMARHRSIAESTQSLRQIELPKKPLKERSNTNPVVMVERLKLPLPAQKVKDGEATKARRNLFVQENRSSTRKGGKMLRSRSVSAVEGLKHKRSKSHDGTKDHYKLLTKNVTETPAHKQMANRLLHKQIKGRCSESPSNVDIVEESPQKDLGELEVRRSPRIKQLTLTRRHSSFYASQPTSRNLERVHSATQQTHSAGSATQPEAKTPKRLLFGEVYGFSSLPTRRARRKLLPETVPSSNEILENAQTPRKRQKSLPSCEQPNETTRLLRRSPRTPRTPVCTSKTPSKTSVEKKSAAKNLSMFLSASKVEEKTPSKSAERRERLAQTTPGSRSAPPMSGTSPWKPVRQQVTPRKEGTAITWDQVFRSPRTTPPSTSTNTPAKVTPSTCTPRKSPRLQRSSSHCVTPSMYLLRTPQKLADTPTPKKRLKNCADTLVLAGECTPEKVSFISPRKTAGVQSMIPCQPTLKTPRKSILSDVQLSCAQETSDPCEFLLHSVTGKPIKEADRGQVKLVSPSSSNLEKAYDAARVMSPSINSSSIHKILLPDCKGEPIVLCERLDMSSLESSEGTESFINTSHTDESIDITDAKVVPLESCDLKMKVLFKRKSSDVALVNHLPTTPKAGGDVTCTSPYGLRHTVDRRQREAAARLGTPQVPEKFSTPKSHKKLNPPPLYEVELEMQASGLPKLRFKRTDSNSTIDMGTLPKTPNRSQSKKGNESPFGEMWCNKHAMKLESACASPLLRSSHSTPGKSGLQTLICHTYTPKRSSSNTASPSQTEAVSPWTPSPKYKDKNGSDVINNWPRKKKAFPVKSHLLRQEKNQDYSCSAPSGEESSQEHDVNKASPLGDLIVDGVSRLLEQSPVIEWKGGTDIGAMSFKSRKRSFNFMSPTKEEPNSKRSCTLSAACEDMEDCVPSSDISLLQQSSCEDDVFSISAFTSPSKVVRNSLSASGLLALTQSPMLFKRKTPSSKREKPDCESQNSTPEIKTPDHHPISMEDSPFSQVSSKRHISRTYTRKKLIT